MEIESSIPIEKMDEKEKVDVMGQKSLEHGNFGKMDIQYGEKPLNKEEPLIYSKKPTNLHKIRVGKEKKEENMEVKE